MKIIRKINNLVLLLGLCIATPLMAKDLADSQKTPSLDQYQSAIKAFGVGHAEASIAAQAAVNTQTKKDKIDVDNLLTQLPADFLEGSPY